MLLIDETPAHEPAQYVSDHVVAQNPLLGPIAPNAADDIDGLRHRISMGIIVVGLVFGGVGAWSALASLDSAVVAAGTVQVESSRKAVQHLEGGIVKDILIKDGDAVKQGDLLIRLHDKAVQADYRLVQGQIDELAIRRARLFAEREGMAEIALPKSIAERAKDPEVAGIIAGQLALFEARQASRRTEVDLLRQQQVQLKAQIEGLQKQEASKRKEIEYFENELEGLRSLYSKGLTPKSRLLALERAAETAKGEQAGLLGSIASSKMKINEIELEIIRQERNFKEKTNEELRAAEAEINAQSERLVRAEDVAQRTEIRAPRTGRIFNLTVHNVGAVIKPGETVMEIVPEDDTLVISARVSPQDVDKVLPRVPATVRLSAFNQRTTPELRGRVQRVSADQISEPQSGQAYYLAVVEIPPEQAKLLKGLTLMPGMPAEVLIEAGTRSPLSYFLKPVQDSLSRVFKED